MERLTIEEGVCAQAYTDFCDEQDECLSCPYGDKCFARLAAYEDTGLEPEEVAALIQPPDDPLSLEELRGMDGEPVWCINGNGGQWGLVHVFSTEEGTCVECVTKTGFTMDKMTYGAMGIYAWLAYRRKPEEAAYHWGRNMNL